MARPGAGSPSRTASACRRGGQLSIRRGAPGDAETFQWIETFTGELTLLSLSTHRYLRFDAETGRLAADARGPHPNERDGVRWGWRTVGFK